MAPQAKDPLPYISMDANALLADRMALSANEFCALITLMLHQWRNGASLPNDRGKLARLAGIPAAEFDAVFQNLQPYFEHEGDGIVHRGLWKQREYVAKQREAKRAGHAKMLAQQAAKRAAEQGAEPAAEQLAQVGLSGPPISSSGSLSGNHQNPEHEQGKRAREKPQTARPKPAAANAKPVSEEELRGKVATLKAAGMSPDDIVASLRQYASAKRIRELTAGKRA